MTPTPKKLIEVALPLEAINKASAREKSIRHGHPSTLHIWWARRPLAAARAVIFAQMVDDPSGHPDLFPSDKAQEKERKRLFKIIEDLVLWENTNNEQVLQAARNEIWASWRRTCAANVDHPEAKDLFDRYKLPAFHDPFAGGGSLPLEAQRLGLEAYASDLNPVAVLINKAMIEIPPKFAGMPPVNPESRADNLLIAKEWRGAQGLAEDVRYYGKWMRNEAEKRIGHLYPKVEVTDEMAAERPDLKTLVGRKLTVIAWIWARTVKSPNPAFSQVEVPLATSFMLSTKPGKEVYIKPIIEGSVYRFSVMFGEPSSTSRARNGTKLARGANFECLMSGTPISGDFIKGEGRAGRLGVRMMAVVAEADNKRIYLSPTKEVEAIANSVEPSWIPEGSLAQDARAFTPILYGIDQWRDLFTHRQLVALTVFSDLVGNAREQVLSDLQTAKDLVRISAATVKDLDQPEYADAIATYLGITASKAARFSTMLSTWRPDETKLSRAFTRNDIAMTWDFAETNPFSGTGGDLNGLAEGTASAIDLLPATPKGWASPAEAASEESWQKSYSKVVGTDPPYYDNIPYADLSDYFYVWLRRSLRPIMPNLFATVTVPKAEELVASDYRHGSKKKAEEFFLLGMTNAMSGIAASAHPGFPVTIYYAFRQQETTGGGVSSTGWETFLDAVIRAGFAISGTWPVRTEGATRMRSMSSNALATSIVLVCRKKDSDAQVATRREFINSLKAELPLALIYLQRSNIAPVDLAQAAIGPGMAVYTRYSKVLDATGKSISVREALTLINQTLDETLAEQEGDFDSDTRWALAWFEQVGFGEGEYGVAETLSKAKNTSVGGMVEAGILASSKGKVCLLRPEQLPLKWDPATDSRLTAWEAVHHLVRSLEEGGDRAAAELVAKLGSRAEPARELAYRLYNLCERKKRQAEALSYNALVQSWPEIVRLAETAIPRQERLI